MPNIQAIKARKLEILRTKQQHAIALATATRQHAALWRKWYQFIYSAVYSETKNLHGGDNAL